MINIHAIYPQRISVISVIISFIALSSYKRFSVFSYLAPNLPTPHISGEGFLANLLKSIVKAFQPMGIELEIDTVPCLPTPIPPDYDRYVQLGMIIHLNWIPILSFFLQIKLYFFSDSFATLLDSGHSRTLRTETQKYCYVLLPSSTGEAEINLVI